MPSVHLRQRLIVALAAVPLFLVGITNAAGAAVRPLELGVFDDAKPFAPDAATWFSREHALGLRPVRITARWRRIAPTSPANPVDPSDPAYDWRGLDAAISGAAAAGLRPVIGVFDAPNWAEAPNRVKGAPAGTWKPSPSSFAAFGAAVAKRYPQVREFMAWNEPNLDTYLSPQWSADGTPVSPGHYRAMLNAFYEAVKAVRPDALIIAGATSPYGDLTTQGRRMPPAAFVRNLLCVDIVGRKQRGCGAAARFDILDHHPYGIRGPLSHALNADDVAIPDLGKLTEPLAQAVKLRTVYPAKPKRLWVTEVSWDSAPPDPDGVPMERLARWMPQTLYTLWRQGADTIMWFLAADAAPVPSYATTYQSGLWFADGRPKAIAGAYRFPMLVVRRFGRRVAWTRAPVAGTVRIERRVGAGWKTIARGRAASPGAVVLVTLPTTRPKARVRAVAADGTRSRTWVVTRS